MALDSAGDLNAKPASASDCLMVHKTLNPKPSASDCLKSPMVQNWQASSVLVPSLGFEASGL